MISHFWIKMVDPKAIFINSKPAQNWLSRVWRKDPNRPLRLEAKEFSVRQGQCQHAAWRPLPAGLCRGNSSLTWAELTVWHPSGYPGIAEGEDEEKTLGQWWGKKCIFISDAFQVLFFPAECWSIYRIQGEYWRVSSSGAAFGPPGSSGSRRKRLTGWDEKRPGMVGLMLASFMLPRPLLLPGLMTPNQGLQSATDGITESKWQTNGWPAERIVVQMQSRMLFGHKKRWSADTCYNREEPWKHYIKWKKLGKKKAMYCMISLTWNI